MPAFAVHLLGLLFGLGENITPKRRALSKLYGVATKKTALPIISTVRTSDPIWMLSYVFVTG
jgi:hypothetical protein